MIFISVFLVLTFLPVAFAASNNILSPVDDLMLQIIPNQDIRLPNVRDNVSLYIFATFAIIYAIVFASTGLVPLFQNERGARIAIAVAFSIMGVLFPGAIRLIASLTPVITIILVMFAVIMIMVTGFKGFGTGAGALPAEWQRERMDLGRDRADYRRERGEQRRETKDTRNEESALRQFEGLDRSFTLDLHKIEDSMRDLRRRIDNIRRIERTAPHSPQVQGERQAVLGDLSALINQDYAVAALDRQIRDIFTVMANYDRDATQTDAQIETQLRDEWNRIHPTVGGTAVAVPGNFITRLHEAQALTLRKRQVLEKIRLERANLDTEIAQMNGLLTQIRNALAAGNYGPIDGLISQCLRVASQETQLLKHIMTETREIEREAKALRGHIQNMLR